ncbi:Pyridoxal 4-dehydrogenase [bacterium HR17]|jgi:aryl-alcohol dehydrogenase-like predicted oxidoreductase|uniref:Pyridoxal 4-dehydrogenase n=1 Tax=Candidatus Fervidibacter japonicus TaxID=2035412 RepID=A0A2H5XBE7_9BACT|nr:Pyridoxal 4-dehydrogenase [bacterium HR17]
MAGWKRRAFLKALGATMVASATGSVAANAPLPTRTLGRTGVQVPTLGLGFGPLGMGRNAKEATALLEAAVELGVTYWDAAPTYGRAHEFIGNILPKVRDKVFLVTKTATDDGQRALAILENALRTLRTDCVDLVHVHNIGDYDPNRVLGKGGVLAGLREAQKRGWVRFVGLSGHLRPSVMAKVLDTGEFDVVMPAMNFADRFTYDFEGKVLPIARKHRVGVVAMKVMAAPQFGYHRPNPGKLADYADFAIRYVLSFPEVACAVVGMFTVDELKRNCEVVRQFKPLTDTERERLMTIGKQLAQQWGQHYGDPT